MDEKELSLLSLRQLDKLAIFKKNSSMAVATDMAYVCGYIGRSNSGACWFYTIDSRDGHAVLRSHGSSYADKYTEDDGYAIRPTLKLSSTLFEQISSQISMGESGVREVNYGEYPQQAVTPYMQELMERELSRGTLRETDAYYVLADDLRCKVYEYFGKRYIRVLSKSTTLTLSSGFLCLFNKPVWVEISPVSWLVDDDTQILVAKKGLLSGVLFDNKDYRGDFESTMMKKYLDTHMLRDLFQPYNTHRELADKIVKVNDKIVQVLNFLKSHEGMTPVVNDLYYLFDKYNFEINKSYDDVDTVSKLYDEFLVELEEFLVDKKERYNQYNEYYKMMDYIKKCLKVMNKEYSGTDQFDELLTYIIGIRNVGIEFVTKSVPMLDDIRAILHGYEADILSYLDGNMDSSITKYKTLEELKIDIRKKIDAIMNYDNSIGLTILSHDAACGKKRLRVLDKYGSGVIVTDLAVLTGSNCSYNKGMGANFGLVYTNYSGDNFKVVSYNGGESFISARDDINCCIRPAFSSTSLFSELLAKSVRTHGAVDEVECGEYPQFAPKAKIQKKLESKYSKGLLKKTGRSYTINAKQASYHSLFKPLVCDEYEYEGKKYIRLQSRTGDVYPRLSNGTYCSGKEYVWIEVTPVVWLIDRETQTFVSKYALLSGITFSPEYFHGILDATGVGTFINKYMAHDIFQSTDINKKNVNYNANEKTYKIAAIVEEIKQVLLSYYGHEDVMGKVETLIKKYNDDIDKAYEEKSTGIVLTTSSVDTDFLYAKLISDLEDILSKIKRSSEKYIEYTKMLELTRTCISILNGEDAKDIDDDLIADIVTIKKVVLSFLGSDSMKAKIMAIFLEYEEDIDEYLRGNEDSKIKEYKTLSEYKLAIRKKLQPYLIALSGSVRDKNMVNEIKSGYVKMLDGLFVKCKDEYINYFLGEIKILIDIINERGNSEDKKRMEKIITNKHEFGDDLTEALKIVVDLYKDLYMVVYDIEERDKTKQKRDDYKIDIGVTGFSK